MSKYVEVIRGLGLGGAETLLFNRVSFAISHGTISAQEMTVVTTRPDLSFYTAKLRSLGVEVIELSGSQICKYRAIRRIIETLAPTAVVFHSPLETFYEKFRRLFARSDAVRFIEVAHSTKYRTIYQLAGFLLNSQFDLCIAVSDEVQQSSSARNFPEVEVIRAGVDRIGMREWILQNSDQHTVRRAGLGIPASDTVIGSVGSLVANKGHRYVIEAMALLESPEVSYILVGDGPERQSLQHRAAELGISEKVFFLGRQMDAWKWTSIFDVLVHPSHFEGLPIAVLEARALGVPVVATRLGGIEEILSGDSSSVLIAEPGAENILRALKCISIPSIANVFGLRASATSDWDISGYIDSFYRRVC